MSNKLGMHIHGVKPGIIKAVALLQPRTITMVNPEPKDIKAVQDVADPVIVVRKYEDGRGFSQTDPRWWAEEYYRMVGNVASERLVALGWNEPFGHDSRALCVPFDEWNRAFIERCRELGPMDGGALAMATGNWTGAGDRYKVTDDFPLTCEIAKWFLPHEYSWPNLQAGAGWYALRFKAWIEDLKAIGREDFYFIISEAGLTQAVIAGRPDEGWRSGGPENVTEDSYIATLDWYNAELCRVIECLGCCLYDYAGQWYGWGTFEQLGLEQRIYQIQAPEPPEPPDPNGGDEMVIKVVDKDYNEKDFAWAETKYGVAYRRAEVAPGQKVYRLVELWEKTGTTSLVTQVLDEDSNPMANVGVAFYWSGAPDPPEPATEVYPHDWYLNFIHGPTNVNGDVGPGMGTGAYHGEGEGGPHAVWVRDPNIPSDICDKLGMLAGTFHDHLDQKFKLMVEGEENGNGNGDDAALKFKERLEFDYNVAALCIAYPTSVAMNTRGDGRGPGVDEDLYPSEWIHPDGTKMAMVEMTTDFEGDEPRTYTLRVYRMSDGATIAGEEAETFQPLGAPRKRVVYVYVKSDAPEPGPPANGTLDEILAAIEANRILLADIKAILLDQPGPPDEGYFGQYFNNRNLEGVPTMERRDSAIAFDWGSGPPADGIDSDNFSVRWTATREFEAGLWRFHVRVDDGVRLWVDGELVIEQWHEQSPKEYVASKVLSEGPHDLKIEYYERGGGAVCELWFHKV